MDELLPYNIEYTSGAMQDITEKADYISFTLNAPETAQKWYNRLRTAILEQLSTMPNKFPAYGHSPWKEQGVRLYDTGNDVILYLVRKETHTVYILLVATKGRELTNLLTNRM